RRADDLGGTVALFKSCFDHTGSKEGVFMKLGPMARGLSVFAGLAILPILAACGQGQGERTEPAQSAPVIAEPVPSPTVAAPGPAAPAPAAALRTSAGPRGSTVD